MKIKHPTYVSVVLSHLPLDDFISLGQLIRLTGCNYNQVTASLHHLRKHRRAEVVVNPDGTGWWFALPEEGDTRTWQIEEISYEVRPRRPRRRKKSA